MKTISVSEARKLLPQLIERNQKTLDRTIITRRGKAEAVLMGMDEYESWVETLEILARPKTVAALREGITDVKKGRIHPFEDVVNEPLRGTHKKR